MPHSTVTIELTPEEREALAAIMRAGRGRADLAKRARIIVRLADGASYADLIRLGESSRTIAKWKQRFLEGRVAGLAGRVPREHADRADTDLGSPHLGLDPETAGERRHAVEHADAGGGAEAQQSHRLVLALVGKASAPLLSRQGQEHGPGRSRHTAHLDAHRSAAPTGSPAPLCLVRAGDCYTGVLVLVSQSPG